MKLVFCACISLVFLFSSTLRAESSSSDKVLIEALTQTQRTLNEINDSKGGCYPSYVQNAATRKIIFPGSDSRQDILPPRQSEDDFTKPAATILPNLGRLTMGNGKCSGSLISGCIVLTAKHCTNVPTSSIYYEHNYHPEKSSELIQAESILAQGESPTPPRQGPWGSDWSFIALKKPLTESRAIPVVIRKKGMMGSKCEISGNPDIIICPQNWRPELTRYSIYGYPASISTTAQNIQNFEPTTSPVYSTECNNTLGHQIGFGAEGMIRNRCSSSPGNSGGPATATVNLNNGRIVRAIIGVHSGWAQNADDSEDDLGWNYSVMPLLSTTQISQLVEKANSCKRQERVSTK